ncbi:hypothetical protein BDP27DRAFT_1406492 [Rhodocollybia butyracea]|uniref:Uncharacterized protein n=1 Tax=Rhodocollybia butyracea TaxID=206335 RepID=A0A9P5PBA6_9AGAR|nr:hypothetical protein BDP27DRAFT_1406492 [Rhodocollybia butyracea]
MAFRGWFWVARWNGGNKRVFETAPERTIPVVFKYSSKAQIVTSSSSGNTYSKTFQLLAGKSETDTEYEPTWSYMDSAEPNPGKVKEGLGIGKNARKKPDVPRSEKLNNAQCILRLHRLIVHKRRKHQSIEALRAHAFTLTRSSKRRYGSLSGSLES